MYLKYDKNTCDYSLSVTKSTSLNRISPNKCFTMNQTTANNENNNKKNHLPIIVKSVIPKSR